MLRDKSFAFILFLVFISCFQMVAGEAKAGSIILAPIQDGTAYRGLSFASSAYSALVICNGQRFTFHSSFSNYRIKIGRNASTCQICFDVTEKGVIEFDISNLGSLTADTFSAELILYGDQGALLPVYDLPDTSETYPLINSSILNSDGIYIGTLNSIPQTQPRQFSIDVTSALNHDLLQLPSSHYSGFLLNWTNTWTQYIPCGYGMCLCEHTWSDSGIFYDSSAGSETAPKLIITTGLTTTTVVTTTTTTTTTVPPTLITLSSFFAEPKGRKVLIKWDTKSEIDNAGFNVLRSKNENSGYVKINNKLIPAKGSATNGASYKFIDKSAKAGKIYYYKLEDIERSGEKNVHGPKSVKVTFKEK